ncbi:MAG: hypothetical protein H0S78_07930 [Tissierellales bacterium]|nr:hypothetical protein [Tissierellales bacterium]
MVVVILKLFWNAISIGLGDEVNIFLELLLIIPRILSAAVGAFGSVTIIFGLIEHFTDEEINIKDEDWDPKDLPEAVNDYDRISIIGLITKIIIIIFALVIFNFYPEKIPVFYESGEKWIFVSAINIEALRVFLPYWNMLWILSAILTFFILIQGKWNLITKIGDIMLSLFSIVILGIMIRGPELINLEGLKNINQDLANDLTPVFEILGSMLKVFFGILIVIILFDIIKKSYKIIKDRV